MITSTSSSCHFQFKRLHREYIMTYELSSEKNDRKGNVSFKVLIEKVETSVMNVEGDVISNTILIYV